MAGNTEQLIDQFCGKYYFNNDRSYSFVAAQNFDSEQEKIQMYDRFRNIKEPKPRDDLPALKIMMLLSMFGHEDPSSDKLFVHDTLYNIEIDDQSTSTGKIIMNCWTGDMQLTKTGAVSSNQAKGKTVITLDKKTGLASMDIGGGWGKEKWVMRVGEPDEL